MINSNNSSITFMLGNKPKSQSLSNPNEDVIEILKEMDDLFGKPIFQKSIQKTQGKKKVPATNTDKDFANFQDHDSSKYNDDIKPLFVLLQKKLTPRKTNKEEPEWNSTSILSSLFNDKKETDSISDKLMKDNIVSQLYFDFFQRIKLNWFGLPYNSKVLLKIENNKFEYSNIVSYLVAYAYYIKGISNISTLLTFVHEHDNGIKGVYHYTLISASRRIIKDNNINLKSIDRDDNKFYTYLESQDISFQNSTFSHRIKKDVENFLHNGEYPDFIEKWNIKHKDTKVDKETNYKLYNRVLSIIREYNQSNILKIDEDSIEELMPSIIMRAMSESASVSGGVSGYGDFTTSDEDFSVEFIGDDQSVVEINAANIKCAAQLFYAMTLGDELEVFNAVKYLTQKFLVRGGMEIRDRRLRENLQMYVFSNKFRDIRTGREMERTRPAERQMFYKQVFNYGITTMSDDIIVNTDFQRLWKVLILETAKYLERAQESPYPMNFVSKQNIIQSVEDLQYNLSTQCTGMVNVITPIIYQELTFVIKEILNHDEIRKQVVPSGGSWWRVVENLYASMYNRKMKTTAINNKAKTGHEILSSIADFNPSTFENDDVFSAFVSSIDSFITTQSILQESIIDQVKQIDRNENDQDEYKETNHVNGKVPVAAGNDEWDF